MKHPWTYPVAIAGLLAFGMLFFLSFENEFHAAAIVVPSIVILCLGSIAIFARKDPFLFRALILALVVKLLAAWVYTALPGFQLSDIKGLYFDAAAQFSESSIPLSESISWQKLWGTDLIVALGASLFTLIGPSLAGAMALFAMVAFWGQVLFYCAFVRAFPNGDRRLAALLLFFFPSLVYWTAAFGKDALVLLATSLIAYGIARRFDAAGWSVIVTGLVLASLVRPHIGAFLAVSLFLSFLLSDINPRSSTESADPRQRQCSTECSTQGSSQGRSRGRKMIGLKFLLFPVFCVLCLVVVAYSRDSLSLNSVDDVSGMAESSYVHNQAADSAFGEEETVEERLLQAPTLMFRPFPWEAKSWTVLSASVESVALFLIVFLRRKCLYRLLRHARAIPLVIFATVFFLILSIVFSISISNFGLLVRQRVMVLPLVLMLVVASKAASKSFRSPPTGESANCQ